MENFSALLRKKMFSAKCDPMGENFLSNSWNFMEPPPLYPEMEQHQQQPPLTSSGSTVGYGINKIYNLYNTGTTWLTHSRNTDFDRLNFPQKWEQLRSSIVLRYLSHLVMGERQHSFALTPSIKIITHLFFNNIGVNKSSLEELKKMIDNKDLFPFGDIICIPMVLAAREHFGRNHIVALLIKDQCLEYFDSKGILSEEIALAEQNETLHDVLAHLKKKYKISQIFENRIPIQFNVHSCGVFVCDFYKRRLREHEPMGTMLTTVRPGYVEAMHQHIFETLHQGQN